MNCPINRHPSDNRTRHTFGTTTQALTVAATSNRLQALEDGGAIARLCARPVRQADQRRQNTYAYDARGRLKRAVTAVGTFSYRVNAQGEPRT